MSAVFFEGFKNLANVVDNYIDASTRTTKVLEKGARAFVSDLLKLPKPMSKIHRAGYTHLVRTFSYRTKDDEVEVGWGKYYGPMVENGTSRMRARPHMYPLWHKNKEKYYKIMLEGVKEKW